MTQPLVQMRGIVKTFPGVVANDHVDLDLYAGEIHALLGENGSGKSTIMSVLAGLYRPDAGEILIDGTACSFASPREAIAAGIGMVYQHFKLVEPFTVAQNMQLGERQGSFLLSDARIRAEIHKFEERFGLAKHLSAVHNIRQVRKQHMVHNGYVPKMELDAQTYTVRADGVLLTCEPVAVQPMAQRYFLF